MKFILSKQDLTKLKELIDTNLTNQSISEMLLEAYLYYRPKYISSLDEYIDKLKSFYEIEEIEDISLFNHFIGENIKEIDPKILSENDYYKNVKPNKSKSGKYSLRYDSYKPFELFSFDDFSLNDKYEEMNDLGFFKEEQKFLCINENDETWMSITPNEINTMNQAVKEATGKVLVLGLGLGYFPYMALNNKNIKEITVVETDKDIIDLFNRNIYPFFKRKITIIKDDGYRYLSEHKNEYDYVFVDTYHNPVDGLAHYKKYLSTEYKGKAFVWIENSIIEYARRILISLMDESLQNIDVKVYLNPKTEEDKIYSELYKKTEGKIFTTFYEIVTFLKDGNIIKLLK